MLSETLTCFSTHQIELTTLPLIRRVVRLQPSLRSVAPEGFETLSGANWPVQYLVEQVIQRMLQFCWRDTFPLLSCLDLTPIQRSTSLLKQGVQLTTSQPEVAVEIAAVGVAYCHLLRILNSLQEFQRIYRLQFWKSFLFFHCQLRDVSVDSVHHSLPLLLSDESCSTQDLIQLCMYTDMDLVTIGKELLNLSVDRSQHWRVKELIELLQERIEPHLLVATLQNAVKETTQRGLQKLLYMEIDSLQRRYSIDDTSTRTSLVVFEFCENHDELLKDANIAQLIADPWSVLDSRVTLFNYLQFLLLFDLLSITMQEVVIRLLQQVISRNTVPPDWREIRELLTAYPDDDHSQERSSLCLELSKLYGHAPTSCILSPCTRCQDCISAAQYALEQCKASLTASYQSSSQTDETDAEQLSALMRECRIQYSCAVYFFQFNRLSLDKNSNASSLLPDDLSADCRKNFTEMEKHLEDLYFQLGPLAGQYLRSHFTEILQGSTSVRIHYSTVEGKSRKRMGDRETTDDWKRYSFQTDLTSDSFDYFSLNEVREMINQLQDDSHIIWFPFSEEGCGAFFLHSVMELLCELFQISFARLFFHTVDCYLQNWDLMKVDGLCLEEQEEHRLQSAEDGLLYMWQGLREMDNDVFSKVTTQYIHQALSSSLSLSYAAKYLIFASITSYLSYLSQNEQKRLLLLYATHDKAFTLSELKRNALVMLILHGCQKYRIPAGTDVIAQVQNPSFLSNVLRSHSSDCEVFWWCSSLMQRLSIHDIRVWDQLLSLCMKEEFLPLCILCLLQRQRLARLHSGVGLLGREEVMDIVNHVALKCLDPEKPLVDEVFLELVREFVQDVDVSAWCKAMCSCLKAHPDQSLLAQGLCESILCVLDPTQRHTLLRDAIEVGGAVAVCEHICFEGVVLPAYRTEFMMAIRSEMKAGHFDQLFYSDFYSAAMTACEQEEDAKELLNEWITYHIQHKHFKDALSLVMKTGWNDERSWNGNDIFVLRDYVSDEIGDENLLCYLLNLYSVFNKHINPVDQPCLWEEPSVNH